jgi:hypothetical protein
MKQTISSLVFKELLLILLKPVFLLAGTHGKGCEAENQQLIVFKAESYE